MQQKIGTYYMCLYPNTSYYFKKTKTCSVNFPFTGIKLLVLNYGVTAWPPVSTI